VVGLHVDYDCFRAIFLLLMIVTLGAF